MTGLLILGGVLAVVLGLLVWMRSDLRRGATARDDLREARLAERMRRKAERAAQRERSKNEGLR